ncbi:hypothetical protein CLV49_1516 [Labedella gwakjiensis]|uniref:Uncharacterized protein n=1 Tax=Labedella gwakjiensis TaxID=390269 RepID=A0A2P8GVB3_9MICO|nr:hypothetical protein [Labedella gwakjiensis]PSL37908.1 hypothetical protein CLV49_1516 [Labedella gwakjiensis]RUQ87523.1 hypothetical protein ELQ93_11615 [Labedella gwakjiensis]
MTRRHLGIAALLATTILLTGCGSGGSPGAAGSPSASATPTAACPSLEDVPDSERDCAVYDPDTAMAENERYREELPVDPETQVELDALVEPARRALEALTPPATVEDVVAALADIGLDESSIQTMDNGTGVLFGAFAGGGCLTGFVAPDGAVTVEAGGLIADGGCLAASGH